MKNSKERFWTVNHPDDADVWDGVIIEAGATLPGVVCSFCGETWSGSDIPPFSLNLEARRLIDECERCINIEAFAELRIRLASVLGLSPIQALTLSPGAAALPFTIKSRYPLPPLYAGEHVVISQDLLASLDLIERKQVDLFSTVSLKHYHGGGCLLRSRRESDLPVGLTEASRCTVCGFVKYRRDMPAPRYSASCYMRLLSETPRVDFFTLRPTAILAVSSKVKEKIEIFGSEQIEFQLVEEVELKDLCTDEE